jgi:hypothetical protein
MSLLLTYGLASNRDVLPKPHRYIPYRIWVLCVCAHLPHLNLALAAEACEFVEHILRSNARNRIGDERDQGAENDRVVYVQATERRRGIRVSVGRDE